MTKKCRVYKFLQKMSDIRNPFTKGTVEFLTFKTCIYYYVYEWSMLYEYFLNIPKEEFKLCYYKDILNVEEIMKHFKKITIANYEYVKGSNIDDDIEAHSEVMIDVDLLKYSSPIHYSTLVATYGLDLDLDIIYKYTMPMEHDMLDNFYQLLEILAPLGFTAGDIIEKHKSQFEHLPMRMSI